MNTPQSLSTDSLALSPLPTASRHKQVSLLCLLARTLRGVSRELAWNKLSSLERRRLAQALERLEGDLIVARILARAKDEEKRRRPRPRSREEEDAV